MKETKVILELSEKDAHEAGRGLLDLGIMSYGTGLSLENLINSAKDGPTETTLESASDVHDAIQAYRLNHYL